MAAHMAVARPSSSARAWVEQFGLGAGRSSGRWSLVGVLVPDGWRDRASLVRFLVPGMYTILKRYLRVFSLRFLRRGFGMSSRFRSPNSFSSGLWSTATVRSRHPSTKCLARSSASATARASPSTGAYRDSAA